MNITAPDNDQPHILLFFTWGVSLSTWKEKGLLAREIRLYEELAKQGVKITFLTWGDDQDSAIARAWNNNIEVVPFYAHKRRPRTKMMQLLDSLFLPAALRAAFKKATILKTNQLWGGWHAALGKFLFRKPLIVRCGYEIYRFTCQNNPSLFRRFMVWSVSFLTYHSADKICVATEDDKNFVARTFGITPDKIAVHPNWIDTDRFAPQPADEKNNHILFVGRLAPQKNLNTLISALSGTDWTLDIVGDGPLRADLKRQAEKENVKINFLGSIPNDQLPALYNRYPVFVLPSHYEGNPKTLLEAMACGKAVLGTNVEGISSVITHGKTGLLCEPDSNDMRQNIDILMKDPALRKTLGQAARRQIINNQTLHKLVDKERALYYTLVHQNHTTN